MKAGNESMKVSEVQFINTLNEEDMKDQLLTRLNDIEARVKGAASRRQQVCIFCCYSFLIHASLFST